MFKYDVVLITEDRYESPEHVDGYIANILEDDAIVTASLESFGLKVKRVSWSNAAFDWSSTRCAVFRTTWDYFHRFQEFHVWMEATSTKTNFINPISVIRWNMDKHYLGDLQNSGVHTVATTFIEKGTSCDLRDIMHKLQVNTGIIKPAISGTARHTYIVDADTINTIQPILDTLLQNESMLFQPFQKNILGDGEISLVIIDGKYTHAVRKTAKVGDFRVQDDFGGTVHTHQPTAEEIAFAEKAIAACADRPLYARVDIIRDNQEELAIMELELIEPELWFRRNPDAGIPFAKAIYNTLV